MPEPTPEQVQSREEVKSFLSRVQPIIERARSTVKSMLGDRNEMQSWIDRGRALAEIQDSKGYKLILATVENEIRWAQARVESDDCVDKELVEVRAYLKSQRFIKNYILTVHRNADISSKVLAGRAEAIAEETPAFVKAVTPPR
jgi:hypothetical protein